MIARTAQLLRHEAYCPNTLSLIANQISEYCYSYSYSYSYGNNNNNNNNNNNDNGNVNIDVDDDDDHVISMNVNYPMLRIGKLTNTLCVLIQILLQRLI